MIAIILLTLLIITVCIVFVMAAMTCSKNLREDEKISAIKTIKSKDYTGARAITIVLHGRSDNIDQFARFVEENIAPYLQDRIFVIPQGIIKVPKGYAWFYTIDIISNVIFGKVSRRIKQLDEMMQDLINELVQKHNCREVEVVGFSQGAMLAMRTMYLSGNITKIHAASGIFLRGHDDNHQPEPHAIELLISHGLADHIVYYQFHIYNMLRLASTPVNKKYSTGFYIHNLRGIERHLGWFDNL